MSDEIPSAPLSSAPPSMEIAPPPVAASSSAPPPFFSSPPPAPSEAPPPAAPPGDSPEEAAPKFKPKRPFSIMKKISLLILGIVVVSTSSYTYFSIWQFKNDKLKYIHVVNSTFTSTIAKKIQAHLDEIISDMQNIVSLLGLKGIDREKSQFLMVLFQNNSSFVSMEVFKGVGLPVATPNPESESEKPVLDEQPALSANITAAAVPSPLPSAVPVAPPTEFSQSYALFNKDFLSLNHLTEDELKTISLNEIKKYLESPTPRKSTYFVDQTKNNILTFVYPLDETFGYFTVFHVNKEFLYEAVSESEVNEPIVVDEKGNVIMHFDRSKVGQFINDIPIFDFAKNNPFREGGMEYSMPVDGVDKSYVGNFYKIGHGLTLLAQADKGRAFEGMQKIIFNSVLFAFDVVGLAIIVGVLFSKTLTAPLQKLMLATENIAAGNYNVQSDINTNDEVGQLADYFVKLGEKLNEREAQLEQVTELAIKDGMTGVFNNRHFRNRMTEYLSLARRHGHELSLILTDIDFFKKFNDTYGHQQGDQVIKDIAQILIQSTRETDFVARYGGEEFVVILPDTGKAGAVQTAERIRQNYKNHKIANLLGGGFLQSTCSLGVASLKDSDFKTVDEMIEHADKNLYVAKKTGRDRVVAD